MKTLIVFSSQTGNTEKICRAAAAAMPDCTILPVCEAPEPNDYDLVIVGYWVNRGMPDALSIDYLKSISNAKVALLGTLGAWPDSDHAKECMAKGEELLSGRNNTVFGTFLCQGKVDPRIVEMMQKRGDTAHPMTEERKARLAEAAKHPDANDCKNAQAFVLKVREKIAECYSNPAGIDK